MPAVVDLAAMRDAMAALGGDPGRINPLQPVELVVDHSIQVDAFGTSEAFEQNVDLDYRCNAERYAFLNWGQQALANFQVVPPNTGIVHQVNLEYMAPPLVVAFALVGRIDWDPYHESLGFDPDRRAVFLHDVWPTQAEVDATVQASIESAMYR